MLMKPLKPFIAVYLKMPLVCLKLIVYPSPWVEAKLSDNFFYGAFWLLVGPFTTHFGSVHACRGEQFSHGVYSFFSARKVILWHRFHHLESWFFCWHGFVLSLKDKPAKKLRPRWMFWQVNFKARHWVVFGKEVAEIQVPIWQALFQNIIFLCWAVHRSNCSPICFS